MSKIRVLFALPGLHRVHRGAEVAFEAIAAGLAQRDDFDVTVMGSGPEMAGRPYRYLSAKCIPRERFERWPKIPVLRSDVRYEEFTWMYGVRKIYKPADYDITCTCSYPFTSWMLRSGRKNGCPKHVFITENSDYPAVAANSEFRWFNCDALVCTNPEYEERNKDQWCCEVIPNGIEASRFFPESIKPDRTSFGLPENVPLILMVSALIPSKHVLEGIRSTARLPDVHLAVAGAGPLHAECKACSDQLMPGRYHQFTVTQDRMPQLYRSADVFLHLSQEEAFGNVYIEALASGLPAVVHDYGTTRWILGNEGFLVNTADADLLIDALQQALTVTPSESDRQRLYDYVATRYDWSVITDQYARYFHQLL